MSNCIFCKIIANEAPADILYQDDDLLVFRDIKPAAKVHILAIPKQHLSNVNSLNGGHKNLVSLLVEKGRQVAVENGGCLEDVRMGFHLPPFNSIGHLHLHVISPASEMGFISRMVFKPNTWWFSNVDDVLDKLQNVCKL